MGTFVIAGYPLLMLKGNSLIIRLFRLGNIWETRGKQGSKFGKHLGNISDNLTYFPLPSLRTS